MWSVFALCDPGSPPSPSICSLVSLTEMFPQVVPFANISVKCSDKKDWNITYLSTFSWNATWNTSLNLEPLLIIQYVFLTFPHFHNFCQYQCMLVIPQLWSFFIIFLLNCFFFFRYSYLLAGTTAYANKSISSVFTPQSWSIFCFLQIKSKRGSCWHQSFWLIMLDRQSEFFFFCSLL